jgi:uncharacterized membrane protein (DUF4010 family)
MGYYWWFSGHVWGFGSFNFPRSTAANGGAGVTTEVAALVTFALGAYLVEGNRALAVVIGGTVVLLLHAKKPMHSFVEAMGHKDMAAIMQFVVIALIILPLLPDREYGPFQVLNPFDIWRIVVLIVGISLAGFIAYKLLGSRVGTLLGGMLGGLISSTATTVSYSRRAKTAMAAHSLAVAAILIASAVAYVRVIIELSVVATRSWSSMVLPILAMLLWMAAMAIANFFLSRGEQGEIPPSKNPAELKSAVLFGLIYAAVLLAVASAKHYFGSSGLYVVALISGLTDMDAITVSIARMVESGRVEAGTGWKLILAASLANLIFKGITAAFLGGWKFGARLGGYFAAALIGGMLIIWLWPESWTLKRTSTEGE